MHEIAVSRFDVEPGLLVWARDGRAVLVVVHGRHERRERAVVIVPPAPRVKVLGDGSGIGKGKVV